MKEEEKNTQPTFEFLYFSITAVVNPVSIKLFRKLNFKEAYIIDLINIRNEAGLTVIQQLASENKVLELNHIIYIWAPIIEITPRIDFLAEIFKQIIQAKKDETLNLLLDVLECGSLDKYDNHEKWFYRDRLIRKAITQLGNTYSSNLFYLTAHISPEVAKKKIYEAFMDKMATLQLIPLNYKATSQDIKNGFAYPFIQKSALDEINWRRKLIVKYELNLKAVEEWKTFAPTATWWILTALKISTSLGNLPADIIFMIVSYIPQKDILSNNQKLKLYRDLYEIYEVLFSFDRIKEGLLGALKEYSPFIPLFASSIVKPIFQLIDQCKNANSILDLYVLLEVEQKRLEGYPRESYHTIIDVYFNKLSNLLEIDSKPCSFSRSLK